MATDWQQVWWDLQTAFAVGQVQLRVRLDEDDTERAVVEMSPDGQGWSAITLPVYDESNELRFKSPPVPNSRLTDEERDTIRRLYFEKNMPPIDIASLVGRPRSTVWSVINDYKQPKPA